jgi:hypothetical protein
MEQWNSVKNPPETKVSLKAIAEACAKIDYSTLSGKRDTLIDSSIICKK